MINSAAAGDCASILAKQTEMKARPSKLLSEEERLEWLNQHIRSRIHAALSNPAAVRTEALSILEGINEERRRHLAFILQASWEGRHASLRWLIEFIGISQGKDGNAVRPRFAADDLRITDLPGGREIEIPSERAEELARIWHALTKVTSHATHKSNRIELPEELLKGTAHFIARHLQDTVYNAAGITI